MRTNPKPNNKKPKMKRNLSYNGLSLLMATAALFSAVAPAQAQDSPTPSSGAAGKKPNILFIMGDDVGWFNIGAYHQGIMSGRTPNLDRLAREGVRFTDYYAEASCTAGRANFITGSCRSARV
jgi:arylsulfatase